MRRNDSITYEWIRLIILKVTADPHVQDRFWALLMDIIKKERNGKRGE